MTGNIEIRAYRAADEAGVVALWAITFPDEPAQNGSLDLIRNKLSVQPELFFVAEQSQHIVGTTIAGFDGVRGWVHKVSCHPSLRRSGVARDLMQAAEKGLADLGCKKLNLQVRTGNDGAVEFYQAAGYEIEDRISLGKLLAQD